MIRAVILVLAAILIVPFTVHAQSQNPMRATVVELSAERIAVELKEGELKGEFVEVLQFDEKQIANQGLEVGDQVLVTTIPGPQGENKVIIVDQYRLPSLLVLLMLFLGVVIFVGRKKGLLSFLAMLLSFLIIGQMVVPQILLGNNPILISLFAAFIIIPVTFYVSHGMSRKTSIAVLATFLSLFITGLLALIFVWLTKLTGFAAEEATFLSVFDNNINMKSLLLAGIIIGAMGVLDDITISQASIVAKLRKANPSYTKWHLFQESMDIGRDHIASLVNTLVLVYAGAALPLFVLFSSSQFGTFSDVLNMEIVATEIVRTLVSSIGIVSAVPITTFLAVQFLHSKD
ncbi:YibE/F family protein [Candidatus Woesebacteria bacterium]|nr:YibE/F family protein [Candidatus Woesebacteria bacterium]